jgi:adenosine deaminase CECR1
MAPVTDEEWADLVAHEIPKTSDPVIQHYLESRRALIAEEQKHRSGTAIRSFY